MKIFTIGLDGGDHGIIRAMPMPNLHKLLDKNVCLDIEEDLWSRGWAKILSGVPAHESGAYYAKPLLDGTHNTTQKFSISDYDANQEINTLWSMLNRHGYSVGFMNVPSMMPAPKVEGFAISGGGAGSATSGSADIPSEATSPLSIKDELEKLSYMLDLRVLASGIKDVNELFRQLKQMTKIRTDAFLNLQHKFQVNFGFLAFMSVCRIQYLAMSEIETLIQNENKPTNHFHENLLDFYSHVDEQLGRLMDEIAPHHIMLVSDHGQSSRLYSVNVNDWLVETRYQTLSGQGASLTKKAAKTLAGFLPKGLKRTISNSAPGIKAKIEGINADWKNTLAFGARYIPGIYINDKQRFDGPIQTGEIGDRIAQEIVECFNSDAQVKEHGLKASLCRSIYKDAKYQALLPDIWIDRADTYFFEQHGSFIEPNIDYGPINSLERVNRDMFTGIKGRYPLLCVDQSLAELVREDDHRDLTLAYRIITRGMDI